MKTAKPPAVEATAGSSRRAQPVRQTRTNPPRTTGASLNRTDSLNGGHHHEQPIEIFPAVTHFTDAITALPKDLVRHFTLLKEVDAKVFAPEEALFQLVDAALHAPLPDPARSVNDASSSIAPASAPMSAQNSSSGVVFNGQFPGVPSTDEAANPALFDPSNLPRRQLFRQTALKIHDMLVSLEEKNHVISGANEALDRQLNRIEELWPHLEGEFSDEAKWGSTTHWAYLDNRIAKANSNSQAERSRRDGAAALSAAAQQLAEEAAARSNDRKQAVAAKKNSKNQQANETDGQGKHQEPSRKSVAGKSRKPAAPATETDGGVGLGISNPSPANGTTAAPKRRKVDKQQANAGSGAGVEKAMASVFGASAAKPKTTSPRGTPAPEATKKRKALPTSSNQAKRSRTAAAASPSVTNSPVLGNFPQDAVKGARASPAPSTTGRPTSSRARQNSIHSNAAISKPQQQVSTASVSNNPTTNTALEAAATTDQSNGVPSSGATASEEEVPKEAPVLPTLDVVKTENNDPRRDHSATPGKKEGSAKPAAREDESKKESTTAIPPPPTPPAAPSATPVTTKSGRASKPSTPALATFAEAAAIAPPRARTSRTSESANPPKRSHKKGASAAAAAAAAAAIAQAAAAEDVNRGGHKQDDEDDHGSEPRYCYCDEVSYGEMVACDADGCKREWFHLGCVGPKNAPRGNGRSPSSFPWPHPLSSANDYIAKWYCEDCKKRLRMGGKAIGAR
ncbi:hypothetical protein DL546_002428 [Coniochaeta pulveracea]|uniref:Chromatin modification-related protein n=1 Tax=Coniochaeta pulveracea TaxID=177199 RepID=A0A420Y9S4_9PEZI|nr:hypothetical protein DL546_002428 [Coniochaeta pulveracea]